MAGVADIQAVAGVSNNSINNKILPKVLQILMHGLPMHSITSKRPSKVGTS
jgi:hypothetical protein